MQPKNIFSYPRYRPDMGKPAPFLPTSRAEMDKLGWDSCDVVLITGDAYIDHPSFGMALVGRLLEAQGFRVGIISQPDWLSAEPFRALGRPNLYFGVTAGNMDSMVNRYTSERKIRSDDAYTPDGEPNKRPDRAVTVYAQRAREAFPGVQVVIGSIEASLRRIAHYDYWSDKVRRSVLLDSKADILIFGNAERALVEARTRSNSHVGVYRTAPAAPAAGGEPLVELIRAALKAEDFQLLFQPMVALQGGEDEQFQALLRLRGDGGKLHTAAEILPVAESAGLAADIDRWVVSRCLLVIAERARQHRPVTLFAGQSIEAARDPQRAAWIGQMLETRRLPGERLVLEFRLPEVIAHVREATAFATALRALGVGVSLAAIDANPGSLQLLQHLPANYLKLAQRYSGTALRDPALREELRQIVTRAHEGGRRVIAPLIEDAQTASLLWTTGVDYLQGDFIQQAGQDMSFDFHAATA